MTPEKALVVYILCIVARMRGQGDKSISQAQDVAAKVLTEHHGEYFPASLFGQSFNSFLDELVTGKPDDRRNQRTD